MSVTETELIIAEDGLVISNGQTSSGLSIQGGNYVTVENGGVLTESLVKEASIVVVDPGGVVRDTSAEGDSLIYVDGTAERLTVKDTGAFDIDPGCTLSSATILKDGVGTIKYNASATDVSVSGAGGQFMAVGGSAFKTVVADGGAFFVQNVQSKIDGENKTFTGLAQSTTILDGGMMSVLSGAVAQDTMMTGGMFHVSSGTASNTTVTGGTMTVYAGVPVQDTVLNGGKMVVSNGSATNTTVNEGAAVSAFGGEIVNATVAGGELWATEANVSGLTVTGGSVVLEASLLAGKSVFAEGASVTVDGTIWFDTQYTTETDAQIKGAFTAGPDTEYMLDAEPVIGVYLLADNLPSFDGAVTFDKYTLKLDEEPVKVGDLVYSLNQNGTALELSIAEYVPDGATLLYVDTAWSKLKNGATVTIGGITATVGTNAFASGDAAALAAAEIEGAKIRVTGGTVFFTDPITIDTAVYSGATLTNFEDGTLVVAATGKLTVNKGATVTGKAVFEEGASITINGTVAFDTQYVTKDDPESVQITLSAVPDGKAAFTLNATAPEVGAYRLLAGVPSFADEVAFGDSVLTVGGAAVTTGGLNYALALAGEENDILVLNVTEYDGKDTEPPVITVKASETEPTCLDVVLTATFTDNVGVTVAQYKLVKEGEDKDLIAWSDYTLGGVTVKDNNTTVYFKARDAAGNESATEYPVTNINRSLDDEPPTITDVHADTTELTDHVVVTATFADNVGVTLAQYKLGEDGEWTDYPDGGVTVTDNLTVYFQAKDAKGLSATNEYKVTNIDKPDVEAPTLVSVTADPPTWTNQDVVMVKAVFTDNIAVDHVMYKLGEDGGWGICPDDGVPVTENNTVYFQAFDTATPSNASQVESFVVDFIDRIPPEKPVASADITGTTDQPVTVSAAFSEDSVTKEYRVDDGEWAAYPDKGVTVTENCVVSFRAFDAAGNESLIAGYTVSNITGGGGEDKTPPTLSYAKADITKPTNKDVTVTALFGDNVGVVSTEYRIGEDGAWTDYPAAGVTLSENAVVYFRAFDAAGNQSEIASCAVTNIDKTLPDGPSQVYVNTDWTTLSSGTAVETYDTSFATVGVNAFATADEANAVVDGNGFIYLEKGTLSFTEAAHNVVLQAEEAVQLVVNNEAGLDKVWVYDHGTISMTKGVMTNCKVLGGCMTVESGAIVDGLTADAPSYQSNSVLVSGAIARNVVVGCLQTMLDMEYNCSMSVVGKDGLLQIASVTSGGKLFVSSGAKAENVNVTGGGLLTVVDARAENVTLAGDLEQSLVGVLNVTDGGKVSGVTVSSGGCVNGNYGAIINDILLLKGGQVTMEETTGSKAIVNDIMHIGRLASFRDINVNEGGKLSTLNSAGIGSAYDTEVQFGGSMQNGGYASNTQVLDGGKMEITPYGLAENTTVRNGGALDISGYYAVYEDKVYESNGIARDLTVENGAVVNVSAYGKLTGQMTFENGATVTMAEKSVLDFDISDRNGKEKTPLVSNYSVVIGAPNLTLTVSAEQADGLYLLAGGATLFDSGIALGEYTLTVGGEAVEYGGTTYALGLSGGVLTLTVGNYTPPQTPSIVYVNDAWAGLEKDTVVEIGGTTATIGYDAFATGDEAVAFIDGDTSKSRNLVFLSDGSAATLVGFDGITVDADSVVTLGGTFTGKSITIDATGYTNFTKKILISEGGYAEGVDVSIVKDEEVIGFSFYDAETLLVNSPLVRDTFANADWTEADIAGTFSDDGVLLDWDKNAFASFAAAAENLGTYGTLYLEGGTSSEAIVLTGTNNVVVTANTSGTVAGSITGADGCLLVENDFTVASVSGFHILNVADSLTVSEGISLVEDGFIVFDISAFGEGNTDALINDLSLVSGAPDMTLTVSLKQPGGTYLLAGGVAVASLEDLGITFGEYTLTVGGEPVEYGDATYTLDLLVPLAQPDEGTLVLTVDAPSFFYVNSEWADAEQGAIVSFIDAYGDSVTATIGTDSFATGDAAVEKAKEFEKSKIEVVGGTVSFTEPIPEPVTVDKGATVTGATFTAPVKFNGTIAFDTDDAQEGAQFTGFENVTLGEDAQLSLSVGELAAGTKIALTDAPVNKTDKNKNPLFGKKISVTVNGEDDDQYEIGSVYFAAAEGISHVLDLDKNGQLVLSEVTQRRENNENDTLVVKKKPNDSVIGDNNVPVTILTLENPEVFLDPKGEVKQTIEGSDKVYYNFVNGKTDKADYAQIIVEHGARLSFTLESMDKAKITLYKVSANSKGQYSQKSLKSASVTKANGSKNTAAVYVTAGTYYVGVTNSNKKTAGAFYNVKLNTASSYIFADADDNWNNYAVKSKALNPNAATFKVTNITESTETDKPLHIAFEKDALTLNKDEYKDYENFVGYTDTVDFAKLSYVQPVALTFTLQASQKATLSVFSVTEKSGKWSQSKSKKTITLKKAGEKSASVLYLDRVSATAAEGTGYYVSVKSTNAKGTVYYNVLVSATVYEDSDFGTNGKLLVDKYTINDKLATPTTVGKNLTAINTEVIFGKDNIVVDHYEVTTGMTYKSFVGLGDQYDYAEVVLNGTGKVTLHVDTFGTAKTTSKFTLYKLELQKNGSWKKTTVGKTMSVKTGANGVGLGNKAGLSITKATSDTVKYFVGIEAGNASKGSEVWYNLSASFDGATSSSALDMPQDDVLAQTFNSIADASFADTSLVDDKQLALQSVPGLIA